MARGFCLDVMHQFDEGVCHFFLEMLVDTDTSPLGLSHAQIAEMDKLWKFIKVTGNDNRQTRSMHDFRRFKAHELRLFVQNGIPFITKDIVAKDVYKVFCLASCIAWTCTKDEISEMDVANLKTWCERFMTQFESVFGEKQMKFSIHLVSHIWYAVVLFGPLQNVSCYGPEDQIGKISKKVLSMNRTTKHIANTFVTFTKSALLVQVLANNEEDSTDSSVLKIANQVLGRRCPTFFRRGGAGTCSFIGKPKMAPCAELLKLVERMLSPVPLIKRFQVYEFNAAHVEHGIRITTAVKNVNNSRNQCIVLTLDNIILQVTGIVAVLNEECSEVMHSFAYGQQFEVIKQPAFSVGTKTVPVDHIRSLKKSNNAVIFATRVIQKHVLVLKQADNEMVISIPSNIYRST